MSILLLLLLTGLVVVIVGVWLATTFVSAVARALFAFLNAISGGDKSRHAVDASRCSNDKCNAPRRAGARFCGRCGCAAPGTAPRLRIASRVA